MVFFKKDGFSIDLDKEIPITDPLEMKLLGFIRNAAGSNKKLETKEFEKWCGSHYEDIDEWFTQIENTVEYKFKNSGLIKVEETDTRYMGLKIKRKRDVLDVTLREKMEQVIGLKKFLQEMSLIDEKEVIEVRMWEEYLIFASILGIADKVSEQLGELCPTFNQQSNLDTIYTMQMFICLLMIVCVHHEMLLWLLSRPQGQEALEAVHHLEAAEAASQVVAAAVSVKRRML